MQCPGRYGLAVTSETKSDLRVTMEPEETTTGKVEHLSELQELLTSYHPECIFVDLHLPIHVAVRIIQIAYASHPDVPITTKVETDGNGSRYFAIKAEGRGIVLEPL
jgi:hypothetical protein